MTVTLKEAQEHGLSSQEFDTLCNILGRTPKPTELGVVSAMWSEHCSYKSSRVWLKTLPTKAPWVVQGPGENAGVIDIKDNQVAVFKIESHNHPSFIEPYQGAATGVGGIMRDVFTMGARPIANMNVLCFGSLDHPKTPYYLSRVVAGIGGYGNPMGIATIGGETNFHKGYNDNILVNAMTVGVADKNKIFYAKASGIGNPVIYVGSKTGRDGIHGATMASQEFTEEAADQRPTVQAGDPFTEKLLLEACLELMQHDCIIAIQDMGAAGLTSSSVEMSDKGDVGMHIDLTKVPTREKGMTPYEIMLSESQERMLMVLKPGHIEEAHDIFKKYDLDFAVIGTITDTKRLVLTWHNEEVVADLPVSPLVESSPVYEREYQSHDKPETLKVENSPLPLEECIETLMNIVETASKRHIFEQYDTLIGGNTLIEPGLGASVIKVKGENKALAMTVDSSRAYSTSHPLTGGKQIVAEAYRNLIAVGAKPLAVTNNLNFGNPENPSIMGQFVDTIKGMSEACSSLEFPVISGNVSLYNETNGKSIPPTPVIGGVGLVEDLDHLSTPLFKEEGDYILTIGQNHLELGSSLYAEHILHQEGHCPPDVDLAKEKQHGLCVLDILRQGRLVTSCRDIGRGGMAISLALMAIHSDIGMILDDVPCDTPHAHEYLFSESQGRYILTCKPQDLFVVKKHFVESGIPVHVLGQTKGKHLSIPQFNVHIPLEKMHQTHHDFLPHYVKES